MPIVFTAELIQKKGIYAILIEVRITKEPSKEIFLCIAGWKHKPQ